MSIHVPAHPRHRLAALPCALLLALQFPGLAAHAQNANIDAQQQQLQQQRENALRDRLEARPDVRLQPAAPQQAGRLPTDEAPCFPLRVLRLAGDGVDAFGPLEGAAAGPQGDDPPLGRCLGARGIGIVAQRLQRALIDRGYVTTRVLAGPQNLAEGTLVLTVVPGRLHAVRFSPDSSPRGTAWNAVPAASGELLRLAAIEQGLDNFKRVPSAEASIEIVPAEDAEGPGRSDLLVHYQQARPLRLTLSADDGGVEATGKRQGSATLSYDNALTFNDLFYLSLGHSLGGPHERGTNAWTAHYSVPYGWWLFDTTFSHFRYRQQVAGATQNYTYAGDADAAELRASRVVWRSATARSTLGARAFRRRSANFIDDTEVNVQHRAVGGYELGGTHRQYLGSSVLDASLALRRGTGAFGSQPAPEEPFGEGTSRMKLAIADLALDHPFALAGQRLHYRGAWHAQWAGTALTPQDRIAIGGRYTVRGFDGENSLLGDRGWFVRNDLGLALGAQTEAYAGLDRGRVSGPSTTALAGHSLTGTVLGLRGGAGPLHYDVFVGAPLKKPANLHTSSLTAGFTVSATF